MKTIILLALLSITIAGGTYFVYNRQTTNIETPDINNSFEGYQWEMDVIQRKSKDLHLKKVSQQELEQQLEKTSLKMGQLMQTEQGGENQDPKKLQFFGKVFGFVSSKLQSLTRVVIPAFNLAKNTLDSLNSVVHRACNPQGAVEGFIARAVKTYSAMAAQICKYNDYYGQYARSISNFATNVGNIIGRLTSGSGYQYQYISESQASHRLFQNLEGLYGSLGARLQCIEAAQNLRGASYNLAVELNRNLDYNSCSADYDSNCVGVDRVNFDYYDSSWQVDSEFRDLKDWAETVAYYTQFVEYCKYNQFYFSDQDLQ